jgi:hypothetical protein
MKTFLLGALLLTCNVVSAAQTESKCFRSEWLQGERSVNLAISRSKVSGTFTVGSGDDPDVKTYRFTGTRRGNLLRVTFADNQRPDISPSEMKNLVWMLVRKRGKELLRIKVYGKNYITNKYENSFAYFEPCNDLITPRPGKE